MAELAVAGAPNQLVTIGLGSCVGVTLYDSVVKVGGMAHIMLPYRRVNSFGGNLAKYADTALPLMIEKLVVLGAIQGRLQAKLAGGAQMFAGKGGTSEILQVGRRNVEATVQILGELGIKIIGQDTGGNYGRSLEFATTSGLLRIRTIAHGEKVL